MSTNRQAIYTIRVERDLLDELHKIAANDDRTLSQYIRVLFKRVVADHQDHDIS